MKIPKAVRVVDISVPIVLGVDNLKVGGDSAYGEFDAEGLLIRVAKGTPLRVAWTVKHEIGHAAVTLTGVAREANVLVGEAHSEELEEMYVSRVLPAYLAALESAGFIRILK